MAHAANHIDYCTTMPQWTSYYLLVISSGSFHISDLCEVIVTSGSVLEANGA